MKRKSFRIGALLLLPLALGALLGGVKWKQLHPTPTFTDLQERARLSKAKIVNLVYKGNYIPIPIDEFKATLNDFYLMDKNSSNYFSSFSASTTQTTIVVRKDEYQSLRLAEIELNYPASYLVLKKNGMGSAVPLHPVTVRRLNELVANHTSAR